MSKRDRFGLYVKIESLCLELLDSLIAAAFESKVNKRPILASARVKIEILKRLTRLAYSIKAIDLKKYTRLETELQEISKMTSGWIRYLTQ
ncbi:MAG: four helix bundle protein [Patescibacteria group bacterium]